MRVPVCLPLVLLIAAVPAQAAPFEDLDRLEKRLVAALDAEIGQPGGPSTPIDRRMKLAACPTPATIDPPALGAVALRCAAANWRIRIPIMRLQGASAGGGAPVQTALLVRRGDPVELQAGLSGFSVSAQAIAQDDGAQGARIRVKTDPREPAVFAEVIDAGIVRVPGFK